MRKSKWKVGDVVCGRRIMKVEVLEGDGKVAVNYGYIYEREDPDKAEILWCKEATLVRKYYYQRK